jgi:hypothetical protein
MKVLLIGASLKPERYSNIALHMLIEHHNEVVAIGLKKGEIAGVPILTGLPNLKAIHTVTLYLNPKRQKMYYEFIINLKPKRVIFNPGTENTDFYDLLNKEGINYIEACTLVLLRSGQF